MKIVAALVMTLALALFPLSGIRAMPMSAVAAGHDHAVGMKHGHDHAAVQGGHTRHHGETAVHHPRDAHAEHALGPDAAGPAGCDWHDGLSNCCNMGCHAMAVPMPAAVTGPVTATTSLAVAIGPLPTGSPTDGLLRPPRRT
jgi:ABC-type nickel/cobalt efflux system permease component RcnA